MKTQTDSWPKHIEAFHMGADEFTSRDESCSTWMQETMENAGVDWDDPESVAFEAQHLAGYYFWFCFPGCLPEQEIPDGPYPSWEDARLAACEIHGEDEDESEGQ